MAKLPNLTEDDFKKIKELLENGKSTTEVGELFGLSKKQFFYLNKKYKLVDFYDLKMKKYKWLASIYLLPPDGEGMPAAQIYKKYGISSDVVMLALQKLGLMKHWRGKAESQRKRNIDNPDELEARNNKIRQVYKDNLEIGVERGKKLKQLYIDEPERKEYLSKRMTEWWKQFEAEDGGKLENRLLAFPNRQKATNFLNGFVGSKYQTNPKKASAIYQKYMPIIDNHTFPDELPQQPPPQPQPV